MLHINEWESISYVECKNKKNKKERLVCVHACLLIDCVVCEKLDEPTLALIRESNSYVKEMCIVVS